MSDEGSLAGMACRLADTPRGELSDRSERLRRYAISVLTDQIGCVGGRDAAARELRAAAAHLLQLADSIDRLP